MVNIVVLLIVVLSTSGYMMLDLNRNCLMPWTAATVHHNQIWRYIENLCSDYLG